MIETKIKIPIYLGVLVVIYAQDIKEVIKKYDLREDADNCEAFCFKSREIYYAVFRSKKPDLIAHECVHLTNMIFKDSYVILDLDNDESQAYLTGWLFKKIRKILKQQS